MKKQVKFLAVLSTAAMMAAVTPGFFAAIPGTSITPLAASKAGWTDDNGEMRYLDSDGYYLTDTWKKKDNDWYYLNEDGFITRSSMVDEYYVNEDGKRVHNQWISEDNDDWDDEAPDTNWYYFGSDGKYVVSRWQTIDNKSYYFNDEGHMQTGKLVLGNYTYYLGDDGAMKTGWIQLENEDQYAEDELVWHYFDSRGRMVMNQVDYKINGHYYTFENGVMQTGWYKLPVSDENASEEQPASASAAVQAPSIASYQYYEEDGKRAEGWHQIEGAPEINDDGEIYTFYFKKGQPHHAETGVQTFSVDSKRYAFNTRGEMQTGLQVVTTEDGQTANYYFGEDGVMKTGKQQIFDDDLGESQIWFFITEGGKKGQGFHGIRDNTLYRNGLRLDADRDLRYAPAELDGVQYLVNSSGSIQKATPSSKSSSKPELGNGFKDLSDNNDKIWTVDINGIIQQ